jgi:hypothetical protein
MNPVVSVIILTFNSQEFIARALLSLRRQTFRDIEIVVVDNGSTDDTQRIVEDCAPIVWLSLPRSDMGMARNHGVKHSRGQFLMFLDSDDFYLDHKVESQVAAMNDRPELDVLYSLAYVYRNGATSMLGVKRATRKRLTFTDFLIGNCYTLATICIRRSAWAGGLAFAEGELGRYGEDWRFQLGVASKGLLFDLLNVPAVVVNIREGSSMTWEIQPKLKSLALATTKHAIASAKAQGITIAEGSAILDSYRFKLVVSQVLVGCKAEARTTLSDMRSLPKMLAAGALLALASVLPTPWIRRLLVLSWTKRQDKTFQWSRPPPHIEIQITALTHKPLHVKVAHPL